MDKEAHNGWTNYATWRVKLELFDGRFDDFNEEKFASIADLAENLKTIAQEAITEVGKGLAYDYAMAFLNEVNYYEIAESIATDYPEIIAK